MSKCSVSKILVLTLLLSSSVVWAKRITKNKPLNRQAGRTFLLYSLLHGARNQLNGTASDDQDNQQANSQKPNKFWAELFNLNEASEDTSLADEVTTDAQMVAAPALPAPPPFYPAFNPVFIPPPPAYPPVLMQPYAASDPNAMFTAEFIKGLVGALQNPAPVVAQPSSPITGSDTLPILPAADTTLAADTTPAPAVRLRIHNLAEESAANSEIDDVASNGLQLIVAEADKDLLKLRQSARNREGSDTDRHQYYNIYNLYNGDFQDVVQQLRGVIDEAKRGKSSARNSNGSASRYEYFILERPANQQDATNLRRNKTSTKKRGFKKI